MTTDRAAGDWEFADPDRELFARELESFVPDRIFDAHAHLYARAHFPQTGAPHLVATGPAVAGFDAYRQRMEELLPGRAATRGLFFPFPHPQVDVPAANEFLYGEMRAAPHALGQMLITPATDPETIHEAVLRQKIVGLKCYHVFSTTQPTFDSRIENFLTEPQVRVAHEEGLSITLHIVRARALADPENQATIRRYCESYPNIRLILAHAARGFNPHHTIAGIESLRGLENVWFDTSVVTDSGAIEAIARALGHRRIMYGSDFPVTHLRGRCVAVGDSFVWLSADNLKLEVAYGRPWLPLVGHEALRTLKVAALALGWSDTQVEDVFYGNAAALFANQGLQN
jgi:glutamate-1-semialdehyde 2,1-aminomutase